MTSPSAAFRAPGQSAADGRTLLESGANNLNALRLALAALVMFSHSFALSYGSEDSEPLKEANEGAGNVRYDCGEPIFSYQRRSYHGELVSVEVDE